MNNEYGNPTKIWFDSDSETVEWFYLNADSKEGFPGKLISAHFKILPYSTIFPVILETASCFWLA